MDKVRQVSEHVNTILRYVPYVQTNFVLGLDSDAGEEPFELTKRFVDLTPGRIPRVFAAVGVRASRAAEPPVSARESRAALPLSLPGQQPRNERQAENYSWRDFYERVIGLTSYTFSRRALLRTLPRAPGNDPAMDERRSRRCRPRGPAG